MKYLSLPWNTSCCHAVSHCSSWAPGNAPEEMSVVCSLASGPCANFSGLQPTSIPSKRAQLSLSSSKGPWSKVAINGRRTTWVYGSLHQSIACMITNQGNPVKATIWRMKSSDVLLLHVPVSTAPGQGNDEDSLVRSEKELRRTEAKWCPFPWECISCLGSTKQSSYSVLNASVFWLELKCQLPYFPWETKLQCWVI